LPSVTEEVQNDVPLFAGKVHILSTHFETHDKAFLEKCLI